MPEVYLAEMFPELYSFLEVVGPTQYQTDSNSIVYLQLLCTPHESYSQLLQLPMSKINVLWIVDITW